MPDKSNPICPAQIIRQKAEEIARQRHPLDEMPDDPVILKNRLFEAHLRAIELELLQESLQHFASFAPIGMFTMDSAGKLTYANPAFLSMTDCSLEILKEDGWLQAVSPLDREKTRSDWDKNVASRSQWAHEFRIVAPTGRLTWVATTVSPLISASGTMEGYLAVASDITSRKTDERIKGMQSKLSQAFQNALKVYIDTKDARQTFDILLSVLVNITESEYGFISELERDKNGECVMKNLAVSGISWDEKTANLFEQLHEKKFEFPPHQNLIWEPVYTGKTVLANAPNRQSSFSGLPEGHLRINSFMGIPIFFGSKIMGVVGLANRPTGYDEFIEKLLEPFISRFASFIHAFQFSRERERLTSELEHNQKRFRQIVETAQEGILTLDTNCITIYVNKRMAEMLGTTPEAMLGKSTFDFIYQEDRDSYAERLKTRFSGASAIFEVRLIHRDGSIIWCLVSTTSITNDHGDIEGAFSMITDITERKRSEIESQRNAQMHARLFAISQLPSADPQEQLRQALNEALLLTDSKVGYLFLYSEATKKFSLFTLSEGIMNECRIDPIQKEIDLENTGVWGEAVRLRQPIILNDFQADHPAKRGYPQGHVSLKRFLTIPVFDGSQIVAVAGVGNKIEEYNSNDLRRIQLLMDSVWRVILRKQSEESLKKSEATARALLNIPMIGLGLLSLDGVILDANHEYYTFHKLSRSECIGKQIWSLLPSELSQLRKDRFFMAVTGKKKIVYQEEYQGEWNEAVISPVVDSNGMVSQVVVGGLNITSLKLAEQALRKSQERFRQVVETVTDFGFSCVRILPEAFQLEWIAGATNSLTGLSPEEIMNLGCIRPLVIPEDVNVFDVSINTLRPEQSREFQIRIHGAASTIKWLQIAVNCKSDKDDSSKHYLYGAAKDITRQKYTEESLHASEFLFETVLNSLPDWIHVTDGQGRVLFMNNSLRQHAKHFGIPDEFIGLPLREVFPFMREQVEDEMSQTITTGVPLLTKEKTTIGNATIFTETLKLSVSLSGQEKRLVTVIRDVTESHHHQQELLRAKEEWELTFNSVPDLIAILDKNRRIIRMNRAMAERLGGSPDKYQGVYCFELLHDPAVPPQNCPHEMMLQNGKEHVIESWDSKLNGHFLVSASPIMDQQGQLLGSVHVARDIAELKTAQKALRESEKRFRAIFEHAGDAILIRDQSNHFQEVNSRACRLLGYSREELLQKKLWDVIAPSMIERLIERIADVYTKGTQVYETAFLHRNGTEIPIEVSSTLIDFGGRPLVVSLVRDITERKRVEQELKESREKYRMLFTSMTTGFALHEIIKDDHGSPVDYRFIEVNPAYEKLTGIPADHLIGRSFKDVSPANELFWINAYVRVAQSGENFYFEHYTPGIGRYYEISAFKTGDDKFATIVSDITQRKLVESSLEESEEKFRALVENMTDVVLRIDPTFTVTYVNSAIQTVFGIIDDNILGKNIKELNLPHEVYKHLEAHILSTFVTKKARDAEFDMSNSDKKRILEWRCVPEFDDSNAVVSALSMIRDVTDRWHSEEALRENEERFKTLARAAEEGIVFSRDAHIIDCNPRFLPMIGLESPNQVIGLNLPDFFAPRYREEIRRKISSASEDAYEAELLHQSGRSIWVRISAKHINYRGSVIRVTALQDLTTEKLAAEKLRESNERLHILAAELESVREEEKTRLSRQIHDELGQILTGIKIELGRLASWTRGDTKANRQDHAGKVHTKVSELSALTDEAIRTTRQIARELRPSVIDDLGFFAAVEWQTGNFQERTGLECDLEISTDYQLPKEIAVNAFRVLQEALTNVIRHAQAKHVRIRLFQENNNYVLSVEDDGVGIGKVELDSSRSLGIMIMQERARKYLGHLIIHGAPGEGTTVRLEIPLEEKPS